DGLGSTHNFNTITLRPNGRVDFTKVEFTYSRLQPLWDNVSAFVSAYGQHAFTPLLSPELCGYGGRFYGRAYDPSELWGDSCWMVVGELRYDVPMPAGLFSLAQLYVFADHGHLTNITPAFGTGNPAAAAAAATGATSLLAVADGTSAGGGVRFGWQNQFNADVYVAKAMQGIREDTRFYFVVTAHN